MLKNFNFKVSYVTVTEQGLERHNDVVLSSISDAEKKDIKSLTFLPINTTGVLDISKLLVGFPILESLYLPSTMTTSISAVSKECPMLKTLLLLTQKAEGNALDQLVAKVDGKEEVGSNTCAFKTFVENGKDGKQTFFVHAKQVENYAKEVVEEKIERLTPEKVADYISGENGIMQKITLINEGISDERCKVDITEEVLGSLLDIFVEKGVTFEEFTIDFSKLYDKIESYKAIAKSVNQVSIKEDIEGNIVQAYQNVLKRHYDAVLKKFADKMIALAKVVTANTEQNFQTDLYSYIARLLFENPSFEDDYKENKDLDNLISSISLSIVNLCKDKRARETLTKNLGVVVADIASNKERLFALVDGIIENKANLENAKNEITTKLSLDGKGQSKKYVNTFVDALVDKDFGTLTKFDVGGIVNLIADDMKNGNLQGKQLLDTINSRVSEFKTFEEIKNDLVDFVAERGYNAIEAN